MPVAIGIASTKTLAKIANHIAKRKTIIGVHNLCDLTIQEKILSEFPIEDIWGIRGRLARRLHQFNIYTAKDLRDSDPKTLRREFSVVTEEDDRGITRDFMLVS